MPLYDFKCENEHIFESIVSIAEREEPKVCPECQSKAIRIFINSPHIWKGLYVLDYPGSKKLRAGYVHTHGDKSATKVSIGPAGQLNPSTKDAGPVVAAAMPESMTKFR